MATGNVFYLKVGDTYPNIQVQLMDGDSVPIDLTGASVLFRMSVKGTGNFFLEAAATIVTPQTGDDIGKVYYAWQTGDTNAIGTYIAEWKVTFPNGKIATFPRGTTPADQDYNTIYIREIVD